MKFIKRVYYKIFLPSENSVFLCRMVLKFQKKGLKFLTVLMRNRLISKYGIHLNPKATIGANIKFPHPHGIVIGQGVSIGDNCTIYHNVTIGTRHRLDDNEFGYPKIGDGVTIYTGATIIGGIKVNDNTIIGAHSLVLSDLDSNCVYAGNPAKKLKDLANDIGFNLKD